MRRALHVDPHLPDAGALCLKHEHALNAAVSFMWTRQRLPFHVKKTSITLCPATHGFGGTSKGCEQSQSPGTTQLRTEPSPGTPQLRTEPIPGHTQVANRAPTECLLLDALHDWHQRCVHPHRHGRAHAERHVAQLLHHRRPGLRLLRRRRHQANHGKPAVDQLGRGPVEFHSICKAQARMQADQGFDTARPPACTHTALQRHHSHACARHAHTNRRPFAMSHRNAWLGMPHNAGSKANSPKQAQMVGTETASNS
eukprot:91993-Chlamydomonas_euryale.AAC.2